MCNTLEHEPTTTEKNWKTGYKVFKMDEKGNIFSPFQDYPIQRNKWLKADEADIENYGFHTFRTLKDASKFLTEIGKEDCCHAHYRPFNKAEGEIKSIFVQKLKVKGIIAVGQIDPMCIGNGIPTFRCSQIKLPEVKQSVP